MSKEQNNFGLSVHDPFKSSLCVSVSSRELQCSTWPVGVLHPVRAQLERFEAGPGCAAREGGAKETHVISVGKASNRQVWDICLLVFFQLVSKRHIWLSCLQVTVVLRPLTVSRPINWPVILVLSSQHTVHWVLENEGLSHNINVLVQVCDVAYSPTLTHWSDCLI